MDTVIVNRYQDTETRADLDSALLADLQMLYLAHDGEEYETADWQSSLWRVTAGFMADHREQAALLGYRP